MIEKHTVGSVITRSWFDKLTTNGFLCHPVGDSPFALSSPQSGRVEGFVIL